ncbi:MAG: repressor LexA [Sorangiineae bacterium PRO1]|nr:repressor LexA [Sorangiineae bacterium PRO1]
MYTSWLAPLQDARKLNQRQRQVLAFFNESVGATGAPPTIRQVMGHCGLKSPRGAELQLRALATRGFLEHEPGGRPAYRPKYLRSGSAVPIVGRAPAGHPSEQPEEHEGVLHLPWRVSARSFAIRAVGDSMIDAHLLDGDLAVVDPEHEARDGNIVLAMLSGECTIKRFRARGKSWILEPANSTYRELVPTVEGDRVVGCIVALFRDMTPYRLGERGLER